MKNAIILHGSSSTPESYWLPYARSILEEKGYDVWVPQLPEPDNPSLKKQLPFVLENGKFTEDTVMIGHSSGCPLILSVLEKINLKIAKAVLVAGFAYPLKETNLILQKRYNWKKIKNNANDFIFINSDDDPWGCDDKQGQHMHEHLGGRLIILHEGHMGSDQYDQPYRKFPLLKEII